MSEQSRTELSALGEFGLIDKLSSRFTNQRAETMKGIGDDAAVINPDGQQVVVSTDMLVEGVHFDLSYVPLPHLGFKAVAVNVSDIAAMNAVPTQITVSLALSNRFSVEAIEALYQGIEEGCRHYGVDLIGGDTTSTNAGLVISVTAMGLGQPQQLTYRNGAKANDIICVTGDLGGAYVGLQVLEREKQTYLANPDMQPQLDAYSYVVERQLKPEGRTDIVHELAELSVKPSAMIDVSDGLASELKHLCKQSGTGMRIYEDKLPIDKQTYDTAVEFHLDPITCALNGGEDYELLFTISHADYEKLKQHADIAMIGYMAPAAEGQYLVTKNGQQVEINAQGWNAF